MGKSARKRKEKRKDFQKVKLKVGKKKALPDNVTNVNFKSRAIHIKEQLKTDESQLTNQRKQNIQELFAHLNHYNTSMRVESLSGLKDLFLRHPQLISENLSSIMEHVSSVFMDKEADVRRSAIALLGYMAPLVSATQVLPFFPVLNSHLCCAMTHIFEDIQLDSLKVLDLVLRHFPSLLTKHSRQLLPNFVDQISRQSGGKGSSAGGAGVGAAAARVLTVNPSSKVSSQKWRRKVLQRLHQFLQALWVTEDGSNSSNQETAVNTVVWNQTKSTHVQLFFHTGTQPNIATSFTIRPPSSDQGAGDEYLSHPQDLLEFIHTLVPILLQIWVEANPGLLAAELPGNKLSSEAMETFHGILAILRLLWRQMAAITGSEGDYMAKLGDCYFKDFRHHLMTCFPYASHQPLQSKRQAGKNASTAVTGVVLNLAVCEVMSYFVNRENMSAKWVARLVEYVCEMLAEQRQMPAEHLQTALEFVRCFNRGLVKTDASEDLLKSVLACYRNCHLLSTNKRRIITFLSDLVLRSVHGYSEHPVLSKWIQWLPRLLIDLKNQSVSTTYNVLKVITTAASQRCQPLLESLQQNLAQIFDPSETLLSLPSCCQRKVIELLYYVPTVTTETFVNLARCCHDNILPAAKIAYMLHILYSRYQNSVSSNQALPFQTTDFLKFLFSVLVGTSLKNLKDLASRQSAQAQIASLPSSACHIRIVEQSLASFLRHQQITKTVCEIFSMLSSRFQVWQVLQSALETFLVQYCSLPISTAYALLYFISKRYPGNNRLLPGNRGMTGTLKHSAAACCLAVLYHATQIYRSGSYRDDSWEITLLNLVMAVLSDVDEVRDELLDNINSVINSDLNINDIRGIALIMIKILQTTELRQAIQDSKMKISSIIQAILKHPLVDLTSQWIVELMYEISLALPSLSKL